MATARKARDGVLILGGGFAGAYVARLLESGSTIVSLENYMLYTPMLPEAASGTLEPRHTVVPIRQMCRKAELLLGRVTGLDEERRIVGVRRDLAELGGLGRPRGLV
jgi:NADH dehydrogenase